MMVMLLTFGSAACGFCFGYAHAELKLQGTIDALWNLLEKSELKRQGKASPGNELEIEA